MPGYGSLSLSFFQEFALADNDHETVADALALRLKAKLAEWGVVEGAK